MSFQSLHNMRNMIQILIFVSALLFQGLISLPFLSHAQAYEKVITTNNATSRIATTITAAATSITVNPGTGALFPDPTATAGTYAPATLYDASDNKEIVYITERVGDILTVERGKEGTVAREWAVGTGIGCRLTSSIIEDKLRNPIDHVYYVNVFAVDQSAVGVAGALDDYSLADINEYLDSAGIQARVVLPAKTTNYVLTGNLTISEEVELEIHKGAMIEPDGNTLTFPGTLSSLSGIVDCGWQIFDALSGEVVGLNRVRPEWWGATAGDNTVDSGIAWNSAIEALVQHGRLDAENGAYYLATGILVDAKPISIIGDMTYGTVFSPKAGLAAWTAMMTVNSTDRGTPSNWWTTAHDNGFVMKNVTFEGGGRDYQCHGLVFTGQNSDVQLDNIFYANIKGSGMKACDPFGVTYDDVVTGNVMQQCQFHNIRMQNCGYEATGGTASENFAASHAAYEIGRNAVGTGSHNHLKHTGVFQLGYSRWRGIRVLNRGGAGETGPNMHELAFQDFFLHGTVSLAGNDENGDAWNTDQHLMTVGNIVADGESSADANYNQGEIKTIFIDRFHVVEMEENYAGIVVGECWNGAGNDVGASVHLASGQFGASSYLVPSYGILFDGAESSYVGGITYQSPGGPANSVYVKSLLDEFQEITLGPVSAEVPTGTPAASATVYVKTDIGQGQIHDLTAQTYTARVPACGKDVTGDTDGATEVVTGLAYTTNFPPGSLVYVSAGFATTGPFTVLGRNATDLTLSAVSNSAEVNVSIIGTTREFTLARATPDYKFIKQAWIVPEWGGLVADNTDYASLKIGYRNNLGADGTGSPVSTTTKLVGGGGTGDWTAFIPVELEVDRGVAYLPTGGSVTFAIDQVGTGVEVPALLVGFEMSDWKYFQDP